VPSEDDAGTLDDRERSRTQRRDRKRNPRMVVDNAGVKRLISALAWRRRERASPAEDHPPRP